MNGTVRMPGSGFVATVLLLLFGGFASVGFAAAPPFYVVRDGKATATVVIPDDADGWTREAAKWVMVYVAKSTGVHLQIVPESKAPEGGLISVGHTQLAKKAAVGIDDLKWDGYRMVVKGKVLYLIGRDQKLLGGWGARGTNRAAIAFAEEFCGVRFFIPTPEGEFVPQAKDVSVPGKLDKTFVPAFAYMDGRRPYRTGRAESFAHNTGTGGGIRAERACSHTLPMFVSADKYFDKHPEYFALIGGKRRKDRHLCTSNPEVRQILLREIRRKLDEGFDWCILGQQDGYQPCQCPKCESMDNYRQGPHPWQGPAGVKYTYETLRKNPCERLHVVFKEIIDECRKSHPDKTIQMLCYFPTRWPSRKFDKYGDNVIAELCDPLDPKVIAAWRGKVRGLSAYLLWGDATMPMGMDVHITPRELSEAIRFLRDNGFVGMRQFMGDGNWGLQGPVCYMLGKLVGNPDLDHTALLEEYCLGVYGSKAGKTMIEFFNLLYSRHEDVLPPLGTRGARRPDMPRLPGLGKDPRETPKFEEISDVFAALYPPAFTQKLDRLLSNAEREAETERNKGWLRLTRDHFDFSRFLGGMFVAYREYQERPSDEKLREVKEWVDRFEVWRERVVNYDDEYVTRWFPRHAQFCLYITADGEGEKIYYTPWEKRRKKVLEKGLRGTAVAYGIGGVVIREPITLFKSADKPVVPEKPREPRALTVKRVAQPPKIDGVIEDSEWKGVASQSLYAMGSTGAEIETEVRVAYDSRNLYLAWQCEEPQNKKLKLKETGRDGPVWSVDCVELMLNSDGGSNARRFHLIVAPAPNSFYDAQFEDNSWNPRWQYAFRTIQPIDLMPFWTVEMSIPFKELGVEPPKSGTTWSANFGRGRYAGELAEAAEPPPVFLPQKEAELFVWSPPKGKGFSNLSGRLHFE